MRTTVEPAKILALFDSERSRPPFDAGVRVERVGRVVRQVGEHCCIVFSQLDESNAADAVTEQTDFFRSLGREVEWKVYGHDRPPNLGEMLRSAGYRPDPPETLMIFDLADPLTPGPTAKGVILRRVRDAEGLSTAVAVSNEAFGPGEGWRFEEYAKRLTDPSFAVFVAFIGGVPVSSARLEMPPGRSFASLWGGGTSPPYRGRGIYRNLVSVRAEMARERGFRFLTVDAREASRPILERLGFKPLTTITGWILKP